MTSSTPDETESRDYSGSSGHSLICDEVSTSSDSARDGRNTLRPFLPSTKRAQVHLAPRQHSSGYAKVPTHAVQVPPPAKFINTHFPRLPISSSPAFLSLYYLCYLFVALSVLCMKPENLRYTGSKHFAIPSLFAHLLI